MWMWIAVKYGTWNVAQPASGAVHVLLQAGYSPLTAMVLAGRGLDSPEKAKKYLDCDGPLPEGDMLWAVKNLCGMDLRQTENHRIMEIAHRRDNVPVSVTTSMQDLINRASEQNFVPVIDDKNTFIGLVTRRAIMRYCQQTMAMED